MSRLSREESRARTRRRLLDAATTCFARQGIGATTVEQIAAEAGFTRGAFYSNFESKDDLVVALVDEHVNRSVAEIAEIFERDHTPEAFFAALYEREVERRSQRDELEAVVLWTELWLYAVRNPVVRPRLAARFAALRKATAELVQTQFDELGVEPPAEAQEVAAVIIALENGIELHRLVDPEAYPDAMFFETLLVMQRGVTALAREEGRGT